MDCATPTNVQVRVHKDLAYIFEISPSSHYMHGIHSIQRKEILYTSKNCHCNDMVTTEKAVDEECYSTFRIYSLMPDYHGTEPRWGVHELHSYLAVLVGDDGAGKTGREGAFRSLDLVIRQP